MRKPDKPNLHKDFAKGLMSESLPLNTVYIVDGGCLFHRVRWQKGMKACDVVNVYVNYVKGHFGLSCVVVFNGYLSGPSVKDHEHVRRLGKTWRISNDVQLELGSSIEFEQDAFMANGNNKQ